MFASISKLFRKSGRDKTGQPSASASGEPSIPAQSAGDPANIDAAGEAIGISYAVILKAVPHNLHGKNAASQGSTGKFFIPRQEVIDQLAQGAVRIPFGSFRTSAPPGTFTTSAAQDTTLIYLPLADIVPQLKKSFVRNPKKRVEVPAEVADVFGARGGGPSAVRVLAKQEAKAMATASPVTPAIKRTEESVLPVAGAETSFEPTEEAEAPAKISVSSSMLANLKEAQAAAKSAPRAPAPAGPSMAAVPAATRPAPVAAPVPAPVAPAPITPPTAHSRPTNAPAPKIEGAALVVSLCHLSENWPAAIQREIESANLTTAGCHLPLSELGKGLKQGKIEIPWKSVRAWLKPTPSGASTNGDTIVSLPLQAIAPMFLAQSSGASAKRKTETVHKGEVIPDVFSAGPTAPPVPPPAAVPAKPAPRPVAPPPLPPAAPVPRAPAPAPAPPAPAAAQGPLSGATVSISLSVLAVNWPQTLVKDIDQKFISKARLEIPVEVLEPGIRTGKVEFSWTELCSWMQPSASEELAAAHADSRLGLPLSVVAPLFLQRNKGAAPKKKAAGASEEIPDLFYQGDGSLPATAAPLFAPAAPPAPTPAPAPAARPASAEASAAKAAPAVPAAPASAAVEPGNRKVKDLAELFGQPDKRAWTPSEIVQKTAQLPGVSGALIALQDGLLVASCMPSEWRTETVAAFLPQIFGRMHQYTKELRMGELHSVTFAVDAGALQIYAAGIIYFATLSRPDSPLPLHELNLIARELSRHTK